jgi:hypothetical protein
MLASLQGDRFDIANRMNLDTMCLKSTIQTPVRKQTLARERDSSFDLLEPRPRRR